jgi:predicted RNA-binding protein with PUA-like domain
MRHWLFKSEPGDYSIDDLRRDKRELWTGVRNYQARNFMRDDMKIGDGVLFYHSACKIPGVAGVAEVCAPAVADPTQFDRDSRYFDAAATPEHPRWVCVAVRFVKKLPFFIPRARLAAQPGLAGMITLKRGSRLSITPLTAGEWRIILGLGADA